MEQIGNFEPQDGKRGWLNVFGVSLIYVFNVSLATSFGLLFEPIFDGSNDSASLVLNLFTFISNFTILATGFLLKNVSTRQFVIAGSLLTSVGLLISSSVNSVDLLVFTFSIMVGVGLGLINPAAFVAVLSCFTEKRNHAIGVSFASLAVGQMIMPIFVKYFINEIGYKWTIFALGLTSLVGTIGGYFVVPIKWNPNGQQSDAETQPLLNPNPRNKLPEIGKEIIRGADFDLLKSIRFIIIVLGLGLVYASSMDFTNIFPMYLQNWTSVTEPQAKMCIRAVQISDIISRLTFPMLTDSLKISNRAVFVIGVLVIGAIRLVFIYGGQLDYQTLLFTSCILGAFRSFTVVMQILIIVDFCTKHLPQKLPGALGMSVVLKAIIVAIMGWVFRSIRLSTSSDLVINLYSHIILFSIVLAVWTITHCIIKD